MMLDYNVDENTEVITLVDLTLESIANNVATIKVRLNKGIDPVGNTIGSGTVFFTPSSSVWAANLQGYCNTTNGNGIYDGADFLRAYANAQAPHMQLVCLAGTKKYIVNTYSFNSTVPGDFDQIIALQQGYYPSNQQMAQWWTTNIKPKLWYGVANQCIGSDNAERYWRYDKMDYLINSQLNYAKSLNSVAEFVTTTFRSRNSNLSPGPFPSNIQYYHSGLFYYGVVFCN